MNKDQAQKRLDASSEIITLTTHGTDAYALAMEIYGACFKDWIESKDCADTQVVNMADIFAKHQDDEARAKLTFEAPLVKVWQ